MKKYTVKIANKFCAAYVEHIIQILVDLYVISYNIYICIIAFGIHLHSFLIQIQDENEYELHNIYV